MSDNCTKKLHVIIYQFPVIITFYDHNEVFLVSNTVKTSLSFLLQSRKPTFPRMFVDDDDDDCRLV